LTVSKPGYGFAPPIRIFSKVKASQSNRNFAATLKTVKISGFVRAKGKGVGGVQINASSNTVTCTKTNSGGGFSCIVPESWSGAVAPAASGYRFKPASYRMSRVMFPVNNLLYEAVR
jgi:hypothetical protein